MALSNLTKVQTLGIGSNIEVVGVITTGQFKSGTSNLHSSGVDLTNLNVSGIATIGGSISIGGTLTYQDVTNVDSVGLITAREGVFIPDNKELKIGNTAGSPDFSIKHDTSNTILDGNTGDIIIRADGDDLKLLAEDDIVLRDNDDSTNFIHCINGGKVILYHAGNQKFETNNTGAKVTGTLTATVDITSGSNIKANTDGGKLAAGASDDLTLFHDGNRSAINNATGELRILSGSDITIGKRSAGDSSYSEQLATFKIDGAVDLYYDGTKFFETTSEGIKLSSPSSTSTDANLLHIVGGGTANRGLKIGTGRASGASQNHAAAIYDAINSESSGYGSQHRFKIAGTDCFTIGYNGDFGYVGVNDTVPYPDAVGSNTVNTCLELGSPSGTDTASVIKFNGRDGNSNLNKCQIQWCGANNRFDITVNGNQALQIQPNKDVEITDGDLIIGTSGHGINFSANGNAGGMTSELLDIYEEGSWTPYLYPMSSAIPITYSHQSGRYTRIGNVVHFQFKLQVSNITGNRNQGFGINGFPFNNTGSQEQGSGEFYGETWDGEIPTTIKYISNTNRGVCYYYADAMKYYSSSMLDINVSSSMLMGAGHYLTHV